MDGKEIWVGGIKAGARNGLELGDRKKGWGVERVAGAPGALLPYSGFGVQKPESTGRSQSRPVSAGAHGRTMPTGRDRPPVGEDKQIKEVRQ